MKAFWEFFFFGGGGGKKHDGPPSWALGGAWPGFPLHPPVNKARAARDDSMVAALTLLDSVA